MAQTQIYGTLENGIFIKAPNKVKWHNKWVINPKPAKLIELGYKLLVAEPYPTEELAENEYWAIFYEEDESNIYRRWEKKTFDDEVEID